jgi:hypothetical protein
MSDKHLKTFLVEKSKKYLGYYHIYSGSDHYYPNVMCVLKEKFKSFEAMPDERYSSFKSGLYFKINDPADEAFFLLWSSDGIEI